MKTHAINQLLRLLPVNISFFKGSEYVLPLKTTFLGNEEISIGALREELSSLVNGDVKNLLEPVLLASELYEASVNDNKQFFITDGSVRSFVFGSKWKAGWVLVLGGLKQNELMETLKEKGFKVFTDCPNIPDTFFIGNSPHLPFIFCK